MSAETWTWPDSLDALTAAPESHRLLFENDAVRVLETRIAPGETTLLHTHRWAGSSTSSRSATSSAVTPRGRFWSTVAAATFRNEEPRCGGRPYLLTRSKTSTASTST